MKTLISIALTCSCIIGYAQDYNPYEELGEKADILTLSKGKNNEFHLNSDFKRIGSVIIDTRTKEIAGFIQLDTMYSEATLEPEIISRWMSLDPLAAKYPSMSPYNFVAGNPLIFIDPDGREVVAVSQNSKSGLQEALFNVFNNGQELDNPYDFFSFDGGKVITENVFHKNGKLDKETGLPKFSKEFTAALSKIDDADTKKLITDFAQATASTTVNYVDVVTNEEAKQTGTNQKHQQFTFYTGNKDQIPENGSSTFVAKKADYGTPNASLTITATQTINNSGSVTPSMPVSTSIGNSQNESIELIKGVIAGDQAKKNP